MNMEFDFNAPPPPKEPVKAATKVTPTPPAKPGDRKTMGGKPLFTVPAKSVINFESAFSHKLLCDGLTFSTGSACVYKCSFCYVPDLMRKSPHLQNIGANRHEDVVILRNGAIRAMEDQLVDRKRQPKFKTEGDNRVIYSSPLVDVAANMELVRETAEACKLILRLTNWQIRLLSKSNLLPKVAELIPEEHKMRVIYGVSTGTLDDKLAAAFEEGTPKVSKRIQSLHELQDSGHRTYGMICPSLPQRDYDKFARDMRQALRVDKLEHVWGEVINLRGDSFVRTVKALKDGGFQWEAEQMELVSSDKAAWEDYARSTFIAQALTFPEKTPEGTPKLRFLQYINKDNKQWWSDRQNIGAILL